LYEKGIVRGDFVRFLLSGDYGGEEASVSNCKEEFNGNTVNPDLGKGYW